MAASLPNNIPERIKEVYKKATCIYDKQAVETALDRMAQEITAKVSKSSPVFICVLQGAIVPLGNLLPRLPFPLELDYAHATRYTGKTQGGEIVWKAKPQVNLKNRTVVIVDDILDEGITLAIIKNYCIEQGAKEVLTAVLIDKKKERKEDGLKDADFKGLVIENLFVFGYGLDYEEYLRNAPGIYAVAEEHK